MRAKSRCGGGARTGLIAVISVLWAGAVVAQPVEINQTCAFAPDGCVAGDAAGFPVVISAPGSYVLTSDLVVSQANGVGIEIHEDLVGGVTIDLGGFSMQGPGSCTGTGSTLSCTSDLSRAIRVENPTVSEARLQVKNGRIRGFTGGGVSGGRLVLYRDLVVTESGLGFVATGGAVISNTIAERNELNGYEVFRAVLHEVVSHGNGQHGANLHGSVIERATMSTNDGQGIFIIDSLVREVTSSSNAYGFFYSNSGLVSDSAAEFNLTGGMAMTIHCLAQRNTIHNNLGVGISVGAGTFRANTLSANFGGDLGNYTAGGAQNLGDNACSGVVCP